MADGDELKGDGVQAAGGDRVVDRAISDEMHESYMQYAMSVIKSRALPDVRDGLKPSQRRVLYAMSQLNLTHRSQRVKSARVVGETMGRYHPHGDSAIYMTLVRMAQPFASRYVLVDKKGNFGTISDPTPAAMRYTECRMASPAMDMVADLDLSTVDMVGNYDNTTTEPTVLPSRFPNLLCNGSQGIAVGMATSIPPHNLTEVCEGLKGLVANPRLSDGELFQLIPGPDFPTKGVICGRSGILQAYRTGRGHLTLRGKVEVSEKGKSATITIRELPYQVSTELLKEKIQEGYKSGKIEGIRSIKDRSKKEPNIVVECKQNEDPAVVLNQLYKFTPLQNTFSIIMIALGDQGTRPRTYTLREMLQSFIHHRYEVIRRRTRHLLEQCRARIHVLEGLQAALDAIDEVIKVIRHAKDVDEARLGLRKLLRTTDAQGQERPLSDRQANAILSMQLQKLTGLEHEKLVAELTEQRAKAADYEDILARQERVEGIFVEEIDEIQKKYGDDRRTYIDPTEAEGIEDEDLIADEEAVVTVTHEGYVKRTSLDQYRVQKRSGKGSYGASTRDTDFVTTLFQASTKDYVLCFTSLGRVFWIKVYQIPEGGRTARGRGLRNLVQMLPDESVTSLIRIKGEFSEDRFLVMATERGVIKKTKLSMFSRPRKGGLIAVNLDDGDQLVGVRVTDGDRELVLASHHGKAIRFHEGTIRAMGRTARGVRGMQIDDEDKIVSLVMVDNEGEELLTASEYGYGKRTGIEDYRETNRGGKGIINMKTTAKNGRVVGVISVRREDQVMLITTSGKLIRTTVEEVRSIGRNTQGVRMIQIDDGERVVALARIISDDDEGDDSDDSSDSSPESTPKADAAAKD